MFKIARSIDGIGGMARTPADLADLVEGMIGVDKRASIVPNEGFGKVMSGSWKGVRVGIVESTWGGGDEKKWSGELVVSFLLMEGHS